MTDPQTYRVVAGLAVPLDMVGRLIAAIRARYIEVTADIEDHDEAVQAALWAWAEETLVDFEEELAKASLQMTIARTVADFEERGRQAKEKAQADAKRITRAAVAPTYITETPGDAEVP